MNTPGLYFDKGKLHSLALGLSKAVPPISYGADALKMFPAAWARKRRPVGARMGNWP